MGIGVHPQRITTPRRRSTVIWLIAATLGMGSCGDPTDPVIPAASVTLSAATQQLVSIGEQVSVTADVRDAAGASIGRTVRWTTTDVNVLTVATNGTATATGNGTADVIGQVDDVADTVSITVAQVPVSLSVTGADTLFNPGVTMRYPATALDALGSPYTLTPLVWETDDSTVATPAAGTLLPLGAGDVVLTVSAGALTDTMEIAILDAINLEVPAALAEELQWTFEDSSAANFVIGGSAAVFIPGVGTWRGVLGESNPSEVINPDMVFYPGSILKPINSAVLLSLANDGTITLDDTLGQWVAPFTNPNIPMGVTVRQLLQNTSGIYSYASHPSLGDSLFLDSSRVWDQRELMEKFVLAPDFVPGTSWKSSNTGYVLGALIAEAATGMTMVELLRTRVFDVMGMTGAFVAGFEPAVSPVPSTWRGSPGAIVSSDDLTTTAAHTIIFPQTLLSANDLLEFGKSLFGNFLGAATRTELLTAVPDDGKIPGQIGAGIGVRQYNYLGRTQWGHSGSQGAGSGFLVWDEASGIVVSVLYNQNGASHFGSHFRLVPRLLAIALVALAP